MAAHAAAAELYKTVPPRVEETSYKELGMEKLVEDPERFVQGFLEARVGHKKLKGGLLGKLRVQTMLLDPTYKAPKVLTPHRPPKKLSARIKRAMKLYEIPKEKQKYELYLPLHELWKKYMEDLLQIGRHTNQSQLNQKVLKADYHGSLLTVARSKCPSYVGTEGILLQETQNTFKLICKDDHIRTIPKSNSVFTFDLHGFQFHLHGNHMRFRASERSARKFKDKPTIDL